MRKSTVRVHVSACFSSLWTARQEFSHRLATTTIRQRRSRCPQHERHEREAHRSPVCTVDLANQSQGEQLRARGGRYALAGVVCRGIKREERRKEIGYWYQGFQRVISFCPHNNHEVRIISPLHRWGRGGGT